MKSIATNQTQTNLSSNEVYNQEEKQFPFNYRTWVPNINIDLNQSNIIRVINYNILCDSLLPISSNIKEESLQKYPFYQWKIRRSKILNELKNINGDIICFEEIERDEVFIDELSKQGYEIAIKPRTGEHSEGCGIAWRTSKFDLCNVYVLEFNMNYSANDISPIYNRDNIGIITALESKTNKNDLLIIGCTHLIFNNLRGDIKLGQIVQLFRAIQLIKEQYQEKKIRVIIGTDLNSTPKSAIYHFITEGKLDCKDVNKNQLSCQDPGNLQYVQPKKLKSYLLKSITSKHYVPKLKIFNSQENAKWYNEICRIKPFLIDNSSHIKLAYDEKYIYQDYDLILKLPFQMKSAYSQMCSKVINYLSQPEGSLKNEIPFNMIKDNAILDNIGLNGIKMGFNEIEKTKEFTSNLTLDLPMSFYCKNTIGCFDFIFFEGNLDVIRILNGPDSNKIVFNAGFLPNQEFPSDHISIAADFILLDK